MQQLGGKCTSPHRCSLQEMGAKSTLVIDKAAAAAAPKVAQAAWWAENAVAVLTLEGQLELQQATGACSPLVQAVRPAPGASVTVHAWTLDNHGLGCLSHRYKICG